MTNLHNAHVEALRWVLASEISDAHKDAYNFRPRGYNFKEMQISELEALASQMWDAAEVAIKEEEILQAERQAEFEEFISNMMFDYSLPKKDALRWAMDAEGLDVNSYRDLSQYMWDWGADFYGGAYKLFKELFPESDIAEPF